MIDISSNGIVTLTRGDYVEIPLFLNQGNKLYPIRYSLLKDNNESFIQFFLMSADQSFDDPIIKKTYSTQSPHTSQRDLIIQIQPEDTLYLSPGKYYYSVRLIMKTPNGNYRTITVIPKRLFFIKE